MSEIELMMMMIKNIYMRNQNRMHKLIIIEKVYANLAHDLIDLCFWKIENEDCVMAVAQYLTTRDGLYYLEKIVVDF